METRQLCSDVNLRRRLTVSNQRMAILYRLPTTDEQSCSTSYPYLGIACGIFGVAMTPPAYAPPAGIDLYEDRQDAYRTELVNEISRRKGE